MPTTYLVRADGELRHGHAYTIDPHKVQWHNASTVHRSDPTIHDQQNSWDGWTWSLQDHETSVYLRADLVQHARDSHDAVLANGRVRSYSDRDREPRRRTHPGATSHLDDIDTADLMQLIKDVVTLQDLPPRVSTLEQASREQREHAHHRLVDAIAQLNTTLEASQARLASLEDTAQRNVTHTYTVTTPVKTTTITGIQHKQFGLLLELALSLDPEDRNIWITGPAGSGKTTAARKLAEALGLEFAFHGAIDTPYKLTGFLNATGGYVSTQFRHIYQNGGVILLDECDASSPSALLELNAALTNARASFPDGMIERHPDCYVLCAANTWGFGGDANYVGRAKLDAAFLDRFITISWPYDPILEAHASHARENKLADDWVTCVQLVREAAQREGALIVISPRASIKGSQLLLKGISPAATTEAIFGRYRGHNKWSVVGQAAETFARRVLPPPAIPVPDIQSNGSVVVSSASENEYGPSGGHPPVIAPSEAPTQSTNGLSRINFRGVRVFGVD